MSSNKKQIALFPMVVYTRLVEDGPVVKFGFLFLSDDLKHDYHQVEVMEKIAFDRLAVRFGQQPNSNTGLSDNCGQQFKSRYQQEKFRQFPEVMGLNTEKVDHIYYEPEHGGVLFFLLLLLALALALPPTTSKFSC